MKRIHKFAAVGVSSLIVTFALMPAALAAGTGVSGTGTRTIAKLPTTLIKGSPPKFSPSTLNVKAKQTGSKCTTPQSSFKILNKKSKAEKVTFTQGGKTVVTFKVPAHDRANICIPAGTHGTLVGKLTDGKKLTVKF